MPEKSETKSQLILDFIAPGSSEFSVHAEAISPLQLLAASEYLNWLALHQLDEQLLRSRVQQPQIVVPGLKIN